MTDKDPRVLLSRLSRRIVRCTDQAECDRMEAELARLQAQIKERP